MKRKKIVLNKILLFIILFFVIVSSFSLCKTIPDLKRLNQAYTEQLEVCNEQTERQKQLKNITDEEKEEMIEEKARSEGYAYPDDTVFYDISE